MIITLQVLKELQVLKTLRSLSPELEGKAMPVLVLDNTESP
jgi:hypothetical protein